MAAPFLHQEPLQRRTFQLLFGAAAAVVVFALVADGTGIRLDTDFDQILALLVPQVHVHHDAQDVPHLVGNLLHEPRGILDAHGHPSIVAPDDERASLGIGEAADPPEVVVTPGALPFDLLGLLHTRRILPVSSSCPAGSLSVP